MGAQTPDMTSNRLPKVWKYYPKFDPVMSGKFMRPIEASWVDVRIWTSVILKTVVFLGKEGGGLAEDNNDKGEEWWSRSEEYKNI